MQNRHLYHKLHVGFLTPYPIIVSWNLSLFENLKNLIYLLIIMILRIVRKIMFCYIQERDENKLFFRNILPDGCEPDVFVNVFLNFGGLKYILDPSWWKTTFEYWLQGCSKTIGFLEIQRRSPNRRRSWWKTWKRFRAPRKVQNICTLFIVTTPKLSLIGLNYCTKQVARKYIRNCSSNTYHVWLQYIMNLKSYY